MYQTIKTKNTRINKGLQGGLCNILMNKIPFILTIYLFVFLVFSLCLFFNALFREWGAAVDFHCFANNNTTAESGGN